MAQRQRSVRSGLAVYLLACWLIGQGCDLLIHLLVGWGRVGSLDPLAGWLGVCVAPPGGGKGVGHIPLLVGGRKEKAKLLEWGGPWEHCNDYRETGGMIRAILISLGGSWSCIALEKP